LKEKKYKFITITEIQKKAKTSVFVVVNHKFGEKLGIIKWNTGWRRYCFFPDPGMQFDSLCLKDLANFLTELMVEHKEKNKKAKQQGK
jgi:hypothetical protein